MLEIEGELLTYKLSWLEILGAFGKSPRAAVKNLHSVNVETKAWTSKVLRGIRAPGTGFPYLIMLGTMRHRRGKDFCVVYKRKPVLILEFENENFKRWVIPATQENMQVLEKIGFSVAF